MSRTTLKSLQAVIDQQSAELDALKAENERLSGKAAINTVRTMDEKTKFMAQALGKKKQQSICAELARKFHQCAQYGRWQWENGRRTHVDDGRFYVMSPKRGWRPVPQDVLNAL